MQKTNEKAGFDRAIAMYWAPAAVFLLSLFATGLATYSVSLTSKARDQVRLNTSIRWARDVIEERLNIYTCGLVGGTALFAAHENPTLSEFKAYAERLNLHNSYPGIQGFGFARRTLPEQRNALLESMRAQGDAGFQIKPPGERDEYYPIVYLEPMDLRNREAIGYDMFSEDVRRQAMVKARDSGNPAASGKVRLVQEIEPSKQQPGFLLYVPVFKGGKVPAEEERREKLLGFVYSPFRAHDLFSGMFNPERQPEIQLDVLHLDVYDGPAAAFTNLLYSSQNQPSPNPVTRETELTFAQHRWTLRFSTTSRFEASSYQRLVPWVLGIGSLLSVTLCAITAALARAHRDLQRAQDELKQHTRNLEETVALRTTKLRETVAELEHMSYSIVHDMRAPLRAIQSFGGMLDDEAGPALSMECRGYVKRMITAAARMDALIRDILNYGKIVREKVPLRTVELKKLLSGIIETYPDFQPASADIQVQEELPAVLGNEGALTQCFSHLLSNAVRYAKPGIKPKINISGKQQGDMVRICVADEGIGIPKDVQGKVFGLFQRLDISHEGTGIGLAIVKKAAEKMGGNVSLESEVNKGTRFYLDLQAVPPSTSVEQEFSGRQEVY